MGLNYYNICAAVSNAASTGTFCPCRCSASPSAASTNMHVAFARRMAHHTDAPRPAFKLSEPARNFDAVLCQQIATHRRFVDTLGDCHRRQHRCTITFLREQRQAHRLQAGLQSSPDAQVALPARSQPSSWAMRSASRSAYTIDTGAVW